MIGSGHPSLGLSSDRVTLRQDHANWAAEFVQEQARICAALGIRHCDVEHIGSTAISSLPAKPILDIMVGVDSFESAGEHIAPLQRCGYHYRGENGIARRHYFVKGEPRTHHLHMLEFGSAQWRDQLRFRDLLRADPALAAEYGAEKQRLAQAFAARRKDYQQAKDALIEGLLARLDAVTR